MSWLWFLAGLVSGLLLARLWGAVRTLAKDIERRDLAFLSALRRNWPDMDVLPGPQQKAKIRRAFLALEPYRRALVEKGGPLPPWFYEDDAELQDEIDTPPPDRKPRSSRTARKKSARPKPDMIAAFKRSRGMQPEPDDVGAGEAEDEAPLPFPSNGGTHGNGSRS
jgi:hypothetical protein